MVSVWTEYLRGGGAPPPNIGRKRQGAVDALTDRAQDELASVLTDDVTPHAGGFDFTGGTSSTNVIPFPSSSSSSSSSSGVRLGSRSRARSSGSGASVETESTPDPAWLTAAYVGAVVVAVGIVVGVVRMAWGR